MADFPIRQRQSNITMGSRKESMKYLADFPYLLGLVICIASFGCSGGPAKPLDMGGEEGRLIAELIDDVNDFKADDANIASHFASASGVPTSADLSRFDYSIIGKPTISGDSATCKVRLDNATDGALVGEKDWSFKKVGGSWKIENAPL